MTHRIPPPAKLRARSDRPPATAKFARQEHSRKEVRASVANSAARMIAEGQADYHVAKQKAARQHGIADHHTLPDNHEIELALREHLALFYCETQPGVQSALRDAAIRVMLRLEQFSPWLVGAVLNGTASEFSEIELELIGVEPKDFEMYLLNTGVEFELCDMPRGKGGSRARKRLAMKYRLEFEGASVTIALYDHHAARQVAHPRDSIRHDRAQRADAERRFMKVGGKS